MEHFHNLSLFYHIHIPINAPKGFHFRVIGQNVLVKIYIMLVLRAEYGHIEIRLSCTVIHLITIMEA